MSLFLIDIRHVNDEEMNRLSISQIVILATYRRTHNIYDVANMLKKDPRAINMILRRVREKGIHV